MRKLLLTRSEQEKLKATGELAPLLAGGEVIGPAEVVTITVKQREMIDRVRTDMAGKKSRAIYGEKYGSEPYLSLVYEIRAARDVMETAREYVPDCPVAAAPEALFKHGSFIEKMTSNDRLAFYDKVATALINGDGNFFQKVAEVVANCPVEQAPTDRWTVYLLEAYRDLLGQAIKGVPTKKQVREKALEKYAFDDVWNRRNRSITLNKEEFAKVHDKKIEAAKGRLIKPDPVANQKMWTERFRKAGLKHLQGDKGGKPTHRKFR